MFDRWYASVDEVPTLMRSWFSGKSPSAPFGVRFECSAQLAATLKAREPVQEFAPPWPFSAGVVGSFGELTGLPVIISAELDGLRWQLTAPIAHTPLADLGASPDVRVVREGTAEGGKPTALDRGYWLVDFHLGVAVVANLAGSRRADDFARRRLASYLAARGHDADASDMKITRTPPVGKPAWLNNWIYRADIAVPREPVRYPAECGDWLCHDPDHYALADPVDDAAVFAGVMAEKRYIGPRLENGGGYWMPDGYGCYVRYMPDEFRDGITHRRRQADGKPLWTIDIRPKLAA